MGVLPMIPWGAQYSYCKLPQCEAARPPLPSPPRQLLTFSVDTPTSSNPVISISMTLVDGELSCVERRLWPAGRDVPTTRGHDFTSPPLQLLSPSLDMVWTHICPARYQCELPKTMPGRNGRTSSTLPFKKLGAHARPPADRAKRFINSIGATGKNTLPLLHSARRLSRLSRWTRGLEAKLHLWFKFLAGWISLVGDFFRTNGKTQKCLLLLRRGCKRRGVNWSPSPPPLLEVEIDKSTEFYDLVT